MMVILLLPLVESGAAGRDTKPDEKRGGECEM